MRFPDTREGAVRAGPAVARFCAGPGQPFDEGEALTRAEALADAGARDTGAQSRQIGAQWSGPPISSVTAPTLVLHGEDDPLIRPRAATVIASRILGARLVTLPGVGSRGSRPGLADRCQRDPRARGPGLVAVRPDGW